MREEKWFALLWAYLRQYWRSLVYLCLFTAIFAVVFALYGLPLEAVAYAAVLCALIGSVALAVRFHAFAEKRRERLGVIENLPVAAGPLPAADTPGEGDFRAMAERMLQQYGELATRQETDRREMLDWYTAWVHQIKTPIAVMQMTLQGEDTPEHRALAAELFRIGQYADMALSYLRLDASASDLVIRPCALDGVLRQAVRKYAPLFVQKRLALRYEGAQEQVLTDEKWLSFIVEQLLDNAVKYTPSGSVTVSVGEGKVLCIADTGIGINPADLPRIFEKGFTGYNGRSDKTATGLGLYLCRQAAAKLHHRLWAVSAPGQGSAFYLDLHSDALGVE